MFFAPLPFALYLVWYWYQYWYHTCYVTRYSTSNVVMVVREPHTSHSPTLFP
jgi:hypothetical protein